MTRPIAAVLAATALVVVAAPASVATETPETPETPEPRRHRLVVDIGDDPPVPVTEAVDAVGGEVVRVDDRLGFAVVRAPLEPLETHLGDRVRVDARGGGGAFVPDDPRWDDQWGPGHIDAPGAWAVERGNRDVLVGIVDSGIDGDHEDLAAVPLELGRDYVEADDDPQDEHGHGTHVAGILSAKQDNGVGIAGMAEVSLYISRVFDEHNAGFCSDFASGIADAVDAGSEVVNFSGYCSFPGLMQEAAAYAEAHEVLLVTSTGNKGGDTVTCYAFDGPDMGPTVLSVGAIDADGTVASYSCREPYVDLAAPGSAILSTLPGGYGHFWGTSMATPHVSATAALLESHLGGAPAELVRSILVETADDAGSPGRDQAYGHGILDPDGALDRAGLLLGPAT